MRDQLNPVGNPTLQGATSNLSKSTTGRIGVDRIGDRTIRVLMVEDDDDDALLTSSALGDPSWGSFDVVRAKTLAAALDAIATDSIDVVLLDLSLPDSRGLETLVAIRGKAINVPVVVLTGWDDQHTAIEALNHGAQDYLVKGSLSADGVARSIRHALERQRLVTSLRGANELLSQKNVRLADLCETAHRFVDNVSHEFRTPLTVIKEFASLLHDGLCGPLSAEQLNAAQIISDRTDDLTCLVHDMMDVSRLKAGLLCMWRRPAQIGDIIEHVRPMLERRAARYAMRFDIDLARDLPAVYCDAGKVGQIITNLVINAIKFTGQHGQVRLWSRVDGSGRVQIGVTDNGPGIEPDKLRLIFERFTQLNHDIASSTKGVGLGLAIVREFVALSLGEISVESAPGKGSTFAFTLPPAVLSTVVDSYLEGLASRDPTANVALLEVRLQQDFDPAVLPVVDEFVQRTARPEDVVYMKSPGCWLVMIHCLEGSEFDTVDRITGAWAEECRNWIYGAPPKLSVQACGNWRLDRAAELHRRITAGEDASTQTTATTACTA